MFPQPYHLDPTIHQGTNVSAVSLLVPLKLGNPESASRFRGVTALWTAVPEASVHENCDSFIFEEEVRFPGQSARVEMPTRNAQSNQGHTESQLCALVALTPYCSHRA